MRVDLNRRLPAEYPCGSGVKNVVITMLGLTLAFAVANYVAGRVVEARDTDWARRKWQLALSIRTAPNWLVLGDSNGLNGILPSIVSQELGGECMNLCSVAFLLKINDAWMLDTCLRRAGAPRNVLMVTSFRTWYMEFDPMTSSSLAQVPLPLGFWRHLQPPLELSREESQSVWLARYVPFYANNKTLCFALIDSRAATLARRLLGMKQPLRAATVPMPTKPLAEDTARGYAPAWPPTTTKQQDEAVAGWVQKLADKPFQVSATNQRALEFICREAERRGIDVWLANGPIHEGLYRHPAMQPYFQAIEMYQRQLEKRYRRVHYLPGFHSFGPADIQDEGHLLPSGGRAYSQLICDAVRQAAQAPGH